MCSTKGFTAAAVAGAGARAVVGDDGPGATAVADPELKFLGESTAGAGRSEHPTTTSTRADVNNHRMPVILAFRRIAGSRTPSKNIVSDASDTA